MATIAMTGVALISMGGVGSSNDVRAVISGGNLYLYGDASANEIAVESSAAGQISVVGSGSTTVNGKSSETLNGWTRGIFVYLYDGDDLVELYNAVVNGPVHIDLGNGHDEFQMGLMPSLVTGNAQVAVQSSLLVLGAQGRDAVTIEASHIQGHCTLDLGNDDDQVTIGNPMLEDAGVSLGSGCTIVPGLGIDDLQLQDMTITYDLVVDDARGGLQLDIQNVQVNGSSFIYGTPENDSVFASDFRVRRLCKMILEDGADSMVVGGQSSTLELFPGLGNDMVVVSNFSTGTASVYLDPGEDSLTIEHSQLSTLNGFGSSGNDHFTIGGSRITTVSLHGESGTDTYQDGGGNSIGKLNLYTIEKK